MNTIAMNTPVQAFVWLYVSILSGMYLEVEFLGHVEALCLAVRGYKWRNTSVLSFIFTFPDVPYFFISVQVTVQCPFFSTQSPLFSVSWRAGLLGMDSLRFYLLLFILLKTYLYS